MCKTATISQCFGGGACWGNAVDLVCWLVLVRNTHHERPNQARKRHTNKKTFWSGCSWDDPRNVLGTNPLFLLMLHNGSPVCPRNKPSKSGRKSFRGCENPAFGKPWVCLCDTRHFRGFRGFRRFLRTKTLAFIGRMQIRHVRRFRQNHLFSAGGKTSVSQNHRFNNPEVYVLKVHAPLSLATKGEYSRSRTKFSCRFGPWRDVTSRPTGLRCQRKLFILVFGTDKIFQSAQTHIANPRPATGVSRALRAQSVPESVPKSVSENRGVQRSVPRSVSRALRAPVRIN